MPSLKDLSCAIELSEPQKALEEFGTIYGDGFVETFVPVPSKPQSFSVHLTSNKFIAPGVAIFVYVDGVYQCNRNRQDLKLRKPSDSRSLVDFRVRQKEERQGDGSMIAREWAFDKLNITSADDAPSLCSPNILENIGCIEVIVLRCAGIRNAQSGATMNFDGAGDYLDQHFGLDGSSGPSNEKSMYDDRLPLFHNFGNGFSPPPPLSSYRQPYVESDDSRKASSSRNRRSAHGAQGVPPQASVTHHTQLRSRYTESVSPGARRTSEICPPGFQYGSGPIPRDGEPFRQRATDARTSKVPFQDPVWLNEVITTAVKQGLEESRRIEAQSEGRAGKKKIHSDVDIKNHLPGAWPTSPVAVTPEPYKRSQPAAFSVHERDSDHGSKWNDSQGGWSQHKSQSKAGSRVTWSAEPFSETDSSSHRGWKLHEETPSDSWDTEETWATNKAHTWEASDPVSQSQPPAVLSHYNVKAIPPINLDTHSRQRSKLSSQQQKSRSKSRTKHSRREHGITSSSSEETGYAYLERPSDSVVSLSSSDETLRASRSRTHAPLGTKSRSKSRSRRTKSAQRDDGRRPSQASQYAPMAQPAGTHYAAASPMIKQATPIIMNAPIHLIPTQVPSWQPSVHPPSQGPQVFDPIRKQSNASNKFPPPYASSLKDLVNGTVGAEQQESRSVSSSSWGSVKKTGSVKDSWGNDDDKESGWGTTGTSGWEEKEPKPQGKNGWETTNEPMNEGQADGWKTPNEPMKDDQAEGWKTPNEPMSDDQTNVWANTDDINQVEAIAWETKDNNWVMKGDGASMKDDGVHAKNSNWGMEDNSGDKNDDGWSPKNNWGAPQTLKSEGEKEKEGTVNDATSLRSASENAVENPFVSETPWQTQTWDFQANKDHEEVVPCNDVKPAPQIPVVETPQKAASASRRYSNKSLSKYRQLRNSSTDLTTPKAHWQFPPPPLSHKLRTISENQTYIAPKEPRYIIPEKIASEKGIEHQVRPGPATEYGHVVGRPEYMDQLDKPYAVFRFKYRSRSILKALFGDQISGVEKPLPSRTTEIKKEKLKQVPQDELIDKMLKLETKLKEAQRSREKKHKHGHRHHEAEKEEEKVTKPSDQTEVMAQALTEAWVQHQSREPSEKANSQTAKSTSKEKGENIEKKGNANGAWLQSGNDGWGSNIKW
ncbi:hypothetical protein A1F94_007490 [Pyrenophora tritici-repentis]|nr:hypothetical protein PtrV1_10139 [Pyrenophora tritici-repentis]KAG9381836.1 hypothetical protein A1F94_007490 [Pyrenophora tritici-repentis]PZD03889.1 hypothetical protein A1F95_00973 [Pyrenophora tritici-repentis]